MEALANINARIAEIQARMAQLSPPVRVAPPTSALLGTTSSAPPSSAQAFGAVLDQAVASAAVGGGAPLSAAQDVSTVDRPGSGLSRVNATGVPVELLRYGNGMVPPDALGSIAGTNHRLWTPAARSFESMRAAAQRDGVTIGITDSYRSYDSQVDLVARKGLYSQGGLAAKPGTSDHGWGMAADLQLDSAALSWMRQNAGAYGFVEDTPRESWHWGYHPTH